MSVDAPHLLALASDLGGSSLAAQMAPRLETPPMTREEVGFYGAESNPPAENCVRWLVRALHDSGALMAAEDKYLDELFVQWKAHIPLPEALVGALPFWLDPDYDWESDGSDPGVQTRMARAVDQALPAGLAAVEQAFHSAGKRLMTFELQGGDHLHFIAVDRNVAQRWEHVVLARTGRGAPLGLRSPDWATFTAHLAYCLGLGLTIPADNPIEWRQP